MERMRFMLEFCESVAGGRSGRWICPGGGRWGGRGWLILGTGRGGDIGDMDRGLLVPFELANQINKYYVSFRAHFDLIVLPCSYCGIGKLELRWTLVNDFKAWWLYRDFKVDCLEKPQAVVSEYPSDDLCCEIPST